MRYIMLGGRRTTRCRTDGREREAQQREMEESGRQSPPKGGEKKKRRDVTAQQKQNNSRYQFDSGHKAFDGDRNRFLLNCFFLKCLLPSPPHDTLEMSTLSTSCDFLKEQNRRRGAAAAMDSDMEDCQPTRGEDEAMDHCDENGIEEKRPTHDSITFAGGCAMTRRPEENPPKAETRTEDRELYTSLRECKPIGPCYVTNCIPMRMNIPIPHTKGAPPSA
ncbi:hypothetical protein K438DRAFT_428223 [Mycena galopus ATCC 62051]|nr:hypothetical protein K438DRAFT_428223 [Mycena galopus ATCC 62051]